MEDNVGDLSKKYEEAAQKAGVFYSIVVMALDVIAVICFGVAIAALLLKFGVGLLAWLGLLAV